METERLLRDPRTKRGWTGHEGTGEGILSVCRQEYDTKREELGGG